MSDAREIRRARAADRGTLVALWERSRAAAVRDAATDNAAAALQAAAALRYVAARAQVQLQIDAARKRSAAIDASAQKLANGRQR